MQRSYKMLLVTLFILLSSLTFGFFPTRAANATVTDCTNFAGAGSISDAITAANTGGGTIDFACSGTITFTSQLFILDDVVINGGGLITFAGSGANRFFNVDPAGSLTLDGLTFTGGSNAGGQAGAIYNSGSFMTITNSRFENNSAGNGGAIYNIGSTLTISGTTFENNSATSVASGGGAIFNDNIMTLTGNTFRNNSAVANGGAIWNNATATFTNNNFEANIAQTGGAIFNYGLLFANSSIMNSNIFNANVASVDGGAIYNDGATITATSNIFIGNSATGSGGGVVNVAGTLTVSRTVFTGNTGSVLGGAIYNGGTQSITNSTFSANFGGTGGAIYNNGVGTVNHSTFANNTATTAATFYNNIGTTTVTYSIIAGAGQCSGTLNINSTNLADNAGCDTATVVANLFLGTFDGTTVPLNAGSPARDNYAAPCNVPADQLNTARPVGSACDVGALEAPPAGNITLTATGVCIGNDYVITITGGDAPYQVTASSSPPDLVSSTFSTTLTITGPVNETGVNLTELGGDTQNLLMGTAGVVTCVASSTLSASAVCNGPNLVVTIFNGDPNFTVTADSGTLIPSVGTGIHTITGPITATNVVVTELGGDTQNFPVGSFNCVGAPTTPVTTTTATVLGCVFDAPTGVAIANAPDNTYCRLLMRNGGVVDYSGAVPADLIGLGVILAVDVYRLEGGMSVNTFPDYARICLAGQGRYFYMDGRNAPRFSVEMPTETVDGLTCAWIPAPGTVILTN